MESHVLPFLATVFVWWFTTGAILFLDGLPRRTFRWSVVGATVVLGASLALLYGTRNDTSVEGAYLAFLAAIGVWGWQEVAFLLGFVTGPRREPCPPGCTTWQRARYALLTVLHHEIAIVVLALAVLLAIRGGGNAVGLWTFLVLWAMRQSAKLNLFLGVRNLSEDFLPDHLRYLESYFVRRPLNALLPLSIAGSAFVAYAVWQRSLSPALPAGEAAGLAFVGSLLVLACLEHVFMLLPLPASRLWSWSFRSRAGHSEPESPEELRSWSTRLYGPFDPRGVQEVLEDVARGGYGEVDRVRGIARAQSGWIRFEMVNGKARVTAIPPEGHDVARVFAVGRHVDETRLQAAFEACAQPVT